MLVVAVIPNLIPDRALVSNDRVPTPKAAVVELPNKAGPALIWLIWNNRGSADYQPYIRCFLPGTLS